MLLIKILLFAALGIVNDSSAFQDQDLGAYDWCDEMVNDEGDQLAKESMKDYEYIACRVVLDLNEDAPK